MRRSLVLTIALFLVLPLLAQDPHAPTAAPPAPPSAAAAPEIGPADLWNALVQGNKQFVGGTVTYDKLKEERAILRSSQLPPITVLACSDSRVPPELIFNQSLGALFVVRTAGNVADEFGLASVEYAIAQGYTRLLVVLGHENCGAVVASLGGADPATPALTALAARIRTSFIGIPYDSRDPANVKKAVEMNARAAAAQLLASSILIRNAVATNRIKVITAYYDLASGEVKKIE
ncbi:MAG: carbonic anhydrase [Acidobacteriota bacterium]